MSVGGSVIVIERTSTGEVYEWDGVITQITEAFVETKHARNPVTHPQWHMFPRAYVDVWIKHYYHGHGEMRFKPNGN